MWFLKYKKLTGLEKFFKSHKNKKFFISYYVIEEVLKHYKKFWISKEELFEIISKFIQKYNIFVLKLDKKDEKLYLNYVNDPKDAQILADAIESWCNILLTDNLKDFKKELIEKDFWLKVVDKLD